MIHLVYVSSSVGDISEDALKALLEQSRIKNKRLGITGMLLYARGNFIQILEGDESSVELLYETITRDSRHKDCILLFKEAIKERSFPEWSMGFKVLGKDDTSLPGGYTEFLKREMEPREFTTQADAVIDLLYLFKKNNY